MSWREADRSDAADQSRLEQARRQVTADYPVQMRMHHVGCAVAAIEVSVEYLRGAMGFMRISEIVAIDSQQVRVCFVETAPGTYLELIEGMGNDSPIAGMLKKRQHYYHVCYEVPEVAQAIERLRGEGFRLATSFLSEAFGGTLCAFMHTPELMLIELCGAGTFSAFSRRQG